MNRLRTHLVKDRDEIRMIAYRDSDKHAQSELENVFDNGGKLWIAEENLRPIAIAGVLPIREGVGHFVFACADGAFDRPYDLIHAIRKGIHACARMYSLFRLQFMVEDGFSERLRFADFLGFKVEGIHPKSGPNGTTWISYGRVE